MQARVSGLNEISAWGNLRIREFVEQAGIELG
jgi:hypothetical protein